jgi:hypothetical protein
MRRVQTPDGEVWVKATQAEIAGSVPLGFSFGDSPAPLRKTKTTGEE